MTCDRIFNLMQERGVKASDVARQTGVKRAAISKWKTGRTSPGVNALILLADYFGVTVDYLVGHDTPTNTYKVKINKTRRDK